MLRKSQPADLRSEVQAVDPVGAYSVSNFAIKHDISRAQTYVEIHSGRLRARKVGSRTIITQEDAALWRESLPVMPAGGAATGDSAAPGLRDDARESCGEAPAPEAAGSSRIANNPTGKPRRHRSEATARP